MDSKHTDEPMTDEKEQQAESFSYYCTVERSGRNGIHVEQLQLAEPALVEEACATRVLLANCARALPNELHKLWKLNAARDHATCIMEMPSGKPGRSYTTYHINRVSPTPCLKYWPNGNNTIANLEPVKEKLRELKRTDSGCTFEVWEETRTHVPVTD